MSSALGILKWTPDTFWKATVYEYSAAMKGHLVASGIDTEGPMERSEYLELKREDERREKRKQNV